MQIHARALRVASAYLKAEAELIEVFQAMDERRGYRYYDQPSLFKYGVEVLRLPEHAVFNLITVARKAREVPELRTAIEEGRVTVSKARKIAPVLTVENQQRWLALAEAEPARVVEREVARARPGVPQPDRAVQIGNGLVELRVQVSEETHRRLERVRDLEDGPSYNDVLSKMAEFYLKRHDPLEKKRGVTPELLVTGRVQLPTALARAVHLKTESQCTHVDESGRRCAHRRWLQIHHVVPLAQGGSNSLENLTLLCSQHHRLEHHGTRYMS